MLFGLIVPDAGWRCSSAITRSAFVISVTSSSISGVGVLRTRVGNPAMPSSSAASWGSARRAEPGSRGRPVIGFLATSRKVSANGARVPGSPRTNPTTSLAGSSTQSRKVLTVRSSVGWRNDAISVPSHSTSERTGGSLERVVFGISENATHGEGSAQHEFSPGLFRDNRSRYWRRNDRRWKHRWRRDRWRQHVEFEQCHRDRENQGPEEHSENPEV